MVLHLLIVLEALPDGSKKEMKAILCHLCGPCWGHCSPSLGLAVVLYLGAIKGRLIITVLHSIPCLWIFQRPILLPHLGPCHVVCSHWQPGPSADSKTMMRTLDDGLWPRAL